MKNVVLLMVLLLAVGRGGDVLWASRSDGPRQGGNDRPVAMAFAKGRVYVAGYLTMQNYWTAWKTLGLSPGTGAVERQSPPYQPYSMEALTTGMAVSDSGAVYVTGSTAQYARFSVVKYDSSLIDTVWSRHYQSSEDEASGNAIAVRAETVYATGYGVVVEDQAYDFRTLKLRPDNGGWATGWLNGKHYYFPSPEPDSGYVSDDEAVAIAVDVSRNVCVTGPSGCADTLSGVDFATVRYTPAGDTWVRRWTGPGQFGDVPAAIAVDQAGNVYVTGSAIMDTVAQDQDIVTLKYSPSGLLVWASRYQRSGDDEPCAMLVSGDGSVYVAGTCQGAGRDFLLVKLNASSGGTLWSRTYGGNLDDGANAACLANGDTWVYVAGSRTNATTEADFCVVKYSATGELRDTWTYNDSVGNNADVAVAVAVDSRDYSVYATGYSWRNADGNGILTVKFRQWFPFDVSADSIAAVPPTDSGDAIVPRAFLHYAAEQTSHDFPVTMVVGDFYADTVPFSLGPGETLLVAVFDTCVLNQGGSVQMRCSVLAGDDNPANDTISRWAWVYHPGWLEKASVLPLPSGKAVKDGGWLVYNAGNGHIYGAKGNKTGDFYWYDPQSNGWLHRQVIPRGTEDKPPSKGAAGCCDGNGVIYATKGNNTPGFFKYTAATDSWKQLANVPLGLSNKKVKAGTDMQYVMKGDTGYVYLLKGYKNEFMRYNTANDSWQQLPDAPAGISPKYDKGSFLVYDGENLLYAHKAKYNELYAFDVAASAWLANSLKGMPFVGRTGRSKKSKDGGSGAWLNGAIYALKGGNTQEFWRYSATGDSWYELDTIPQLGSTGRKKKVKAGGDIATAGQKLYALKGNKCNEFWRYLPTEQGMDAFAMPFGTTKPAHPPTDDGESPFVEGISGSRPRWRNDGTAITYTRETDGISQVFMAMYGQPNVEYQLTSLPDDVEDVSFDPTGTWLAFTYYDSLTNRTQVGKVLAVPVPTQVIQLTFDVADKSLPEWEQTSGQWLVYERVDENTGYVQLARVPAAGGSAQVLTSDPSDHLEPSFLNPAELLYVLSPDNGYEELYRLNLTTMQQTQITSSPRDHESPCAALGSVAGFTAQDEAGTYQIGTVNANGTGERLITSDFNDLEAPDWQANGAALHCARWFGLTSEICRVDTSGSVQALTDANAIRDNPDTYWNQNMNTSFVVYEREDTSTQTDYRPRKPKKGTGLFLAKSRRPIGDGVMSGRSYVLALHKALPNPFRRLVQIRWSVPKLQDVSLRVYNTAGQQVRTLAQGPQKPGAYATVWNGTDHKGRRLAAGVYFYTLETGDKRLSRKVVLTE